MADYAVVFARSARKELERLPTSVVERIFPQIMKLAAQPRPIGCEKLEGEKNLWRIRRGDYRVVYSVDDGARAVDVRRVRHRREAYR